MMSEDTFMEICRTLARADFSGDLHLHGYGEPLLDTRLCYFVKVAKAILPRSRVWVATNGDLLTKDLENKLSLSGLDKLIVTRHEVSGLPDVTYNIGNMRIDCVSLSGTIFNRAGLVKLEDVAWRRIKICLHAVNLFISASGDLAFCCHDYAARKGMGINVSDKKWLDRWRSRENRLLRLRSIVGPRPPACKGCLIGAI